MSRLEADGNRLIDVARRKPAAPVPTCPDWSADDLLRHTTAVWTAFGAQAESLSSEPIAWDELPELAPAEALTHAVKALGAHPPDTPVWTWSSDQTLGFFQRRAHLETLVHRVDAELAVGERTPVPPDDGIDGVDEFFTHLARLAGKAPPGGSLHLHQTDGDGEFMLQVVDGAIVMSHEHAKGDAALRATGEELLLCVWGRRDLDGLEVFGDTDIAAQWTRLAP